ncbi:glycoside hydrolase family 3 N-terminal domain-containing protein, partial [Haliscomenobacter sp.]|uniref:glycoside hydrolase family 3 protein n=1 Tax=Haliscomenobacter sp. TaxID=2717303 RepID=UPI003364C885
MQKLCTTFILLISSIFVFAQQKWTEKQIENFALINQRGKTLAYSPSSGMKILTVNDLAFKDLNKNGQLDPYEDWRLPADARAKDLASKMSIEQIAGLMLYSRHQSLPARSGGYFAGTYKGKPFQESGAKPEDLSDQQIEFLIKDNLRHVLITTVQSPEIAARWNNNMQALVEGTGLGIPANNSSDPRHGTVANAEYNAAAGGAISMWPSSLGMAATFDPILVTRFGQIAATEYRALGITTALSPQVDIATDPRWSRTSGTFGEDPYLAAAMASAYCNGFQTSTGYGADPDGWGMYSVNAMVKHWPGGGSGEAGRDAHYAIGKFAVYPGKQFKTHFIPFTEGAFKLQGKTMMASAIMPYYTISWDQDTKNKENVGNSYNRYIIQDLLRDKYKFDGVACTDWGITGDETVLDNLTAGKPWGVEKLSLAERHYKILMAGVDQFGGNNEAKPIIEAYAIGSKEHGKAWMRARMEQSAVRLLKNIFRVGLFEFPYVVPETTKLIVGQPSYMKSGYEAQLKSMVLLKNQKQALPLKTGIKVYVPKKFTPAGRNFMGVETPERLDYPVNIEIVKKYFTVTDNPDEADVALAFISSPNSGIGYSAEDVKKGGNGYLPISLQYGEYKATEARGVSIAGGDPLEKSTNRSYKDKTNQAINHTDLGMVTDTYDKMKGKPVIVSITMDNPMVFNEFESKANAILVNFRVQDQAIL